VALGLGFLLLWIWGTVAVVMSAGERTPVLAVAHGVGRFEPIERSDLEVVRVGVPRGVETVPAGLLDDLSGQTAAVDLVAGALLTPGQIVVDGERVVTDAEVVVGARLKPEELPPEGVREGSAVLIVVRSSPTISAGGGEVSEVDGWLMSVGEADQVTGERSLSLVVPRSTASAVTAGAAEGRVSVVVVVG
jgi:hypothetical protein